MSTLLREAAIRHLRSLTTAGAEGAVRRISIDVEVGGRLETVIVSLRDQALQCVSSDGRSDGQHVAAALRFVAGFQAQEDALRPGSSYIVESHGCKYK